MTVWCSWLGCRVFQHFTAQGPADPSGCSKTSQGHVAVVNLVAAGFTPWQVHPHIESTSDQMFKIYLSFTEKTRQHGSHDETKPHKTCLFLVL